MVLLLSIDISVFPREKPSFVFFLFCVRFVSLDELDKLNENQSSMTEAFLCLSLTVDSLVYASLLISRSMDQTSQKSFKYYIISYHLIR